MSQSLISEPISADCVECKDLTEREGRWAENLWLEDYWTDEVTLRTWVHDQSIWNKVRHGGETLKQGHLTILGEEVRTWVRVWKIPTCGVDLTCRVNDE